MKLIKCQGKSFVTTNDVASAVINFSAAAQRRGRVVRIDVPIVTDGEPPFIELVLSPGEQLDVSDSDVVEVELDTAPLIRSLANRRLAWLPHRAQE